MSEEQLLANIFRILQESWEREIDPLKSEIEKIKSCMTEIKEYIAIQKNDKDKEAQKKKETTLNPLLIKIAFLSGIITLLVNVALRYLPMIK
jgi:DNA-binding transcriptional regulator GbsR (MarR family)